MNRNALLFCLISGLTVLAVSIPAQILISDSHALHAGPVKDYVTATEARSGLMQKDRENLVALSGSDGPGQSMRQFPGREVVLLIEPGLEGLSEQAVRRFVDDCDLLYDYYRDALGWEPGGEGLLEIAIFDIPNSGSGYGALGNKGMAIDSGGLPGTPEFSDRTYPEYLIRVAEHEMAHNFDTQGFFIFSGPDPPHAWTSFWDRYLSVYNWEAFDVKPVLDGLRVLAGGVRPPYVDHPEWSWEECVPVSGATCPVPSGSIYGVPEIAQGLLIESIALLHGSGGIRRAMHFLGEAIQTRGLNHETMNALDKNDLLIESLGHGTGADISCYLDQWRWPVSQHLRDTFAADYGPNRNCVDADGDGLSFIEGDRDDQDPSAYPGAPELPDDGVDNNYDTAIDEMLVIEDGDFPAFGEAPLRVAVPSRVRGMISSLQDGDLFEIDLLTDADVRFTMTWVPIESLTVTNLGYSILVEPPGRGLRGFGGRDVAGNSLNINVQRLEAGKHLIYVFPPLATTEPGPYDLLISIDPGIPAVPAAPYPETGAGRHRLSLPPVPESAANLPNLSARFWVEGSGWVHTAAVTSQNAATVSQSGAATLNWAVPAEFDWCDQSYRVQYFSGDLPAAPMSRRTAFAARGRPCLSAAGVVNAASFVGGAVAPGEIITLFGAGLGPSFIAGATLTEGGLLDNRLAETRVLFDGQPAPLVFAYGSQASAIVPYALDGSGSTSLEVEYRGIRSDPVDLAVTDASPALFTRNSSGQGGGAILNQDFSLNSGTNPAAPGSVILLYATGEGQTSPAGTDGLLASEVLPKPRRNVRVELIVVSGFRSVWPLPVLYAGAAPDLVAGVMQVNARIPDNLPPGTHDVILTVGDKSSSEGVTVVVE